MNNISIVCDNESISCCVYRKR